ncbi:hypothetical protein E2C01_016124 [Portunus trituberculatus]|uniref:Uncharacterized protein n=1 Tax=Portunus trituberculatus TaxID=210409 RepID=A0A5B7DPQ1_PORTR|nr:hypothetical protein [Portunus trituberculatus]
MADSQKQSNNEKESTSTALTEAIDLIMNWKPTSDVYFVHRPLILETFKCPVCVEIRGGMVQLFTGFVYPLMLAPLAAMQYTSSCHPPPPPSPPPATPTPQPTTSHIEQIKGNEEEKASLLTIREALLQNIEKGIEAVDNDDKLVMLTKRRLKNHLSSRCSCPDPVFDYSFELDVYENTITMHCTTCNFKNTS